MLLLANSSATGRKWAVVGAANEFMIGEENKPLWMPYGDYPYHWEDIPEVGKRFVMQRWDAESARHLQTALANEKSKGAPGIPIYAGHPDVPALAHKYPEKDAKGWITACNTSDGGCNLSVEWLAGPPAKRWIYFSPYWRGPCISDDGANVLMHVREVQSIGMVNNPQIHQFRLPNESADTEETQQQEEKPMNEELKRILGLPTDADDATVAAKAKELLKRVEDAEAKVAALTAEKTEAEKNATEAKTEKEKSDLAYANERKARVGLMLDAALADGRVTAATKARWEQRLTENFEVNVIALANEKPQMKTESVLGGAGSRHTTTVDATTRIVTAVNEKTAKGAKYDDAFVAVQQEHPEWFKNPEVK